MVRVVARKKEKAREGSEQKLEGERCRKMNAELKMGYGEWLLLVMLSILWGGAYFFAKVALVEVSPLLLVWVRVSIAALALGTLIRFLGKRVPRSRQVWKSFFIMGAVNNLIPYSLLFWGQTHIGGGLASILGATVPVFTVLVAHLTTRDERLSPNKVIGVLFGVVGVGVMIGGDLGSGQGPVWIAAMLACVGGALGYAVATVYGRRFHSMGIEPMMVAFGQVSATTILMAPIAIGFERPWNMAPPSGSTIVAVLGLGLLSTALAYVIYFRILAKGGATNLSLVTFLIPISAILLGVVVLGERLELSHLAGMGMIFMGLGALDGRVLRILRRQRPVELCAECAGSRSARTLK